MEFNEAEAIVSCEIIKQNVCIVYLLMVFIYCFHTVCLAEI